MTSQGLQKATNSKDSVSSITLFYIINTFSYLIIVNDKTVATDEVYFATEQGCILDVDYRHMSLFRKTTTHSLLAQTETSIARMSRPNNIIDRRKNRAGHDNSLLGQHTNRSHGSQRYDTRSKKSLSQPAQNPNFMRRGTISFMKGVYLAKIHKAGASGFVDGSLGGDNLPNITERSESGQREHRQANMSALPKDGQTSLIGAGSLG